MSMAFMPNYSMPLPDVQAAGNVLKQIVNVRNLVLFGGLLSKLVSLRNVVFLVITLNICAASAGTTADYGQDPADLALPETRSEVVIAEAFLTLGNTVFGPRIEAASVGKFGNIFATDFNGSPGGKVKATSTSFLGQVSDASSSLDQEGFFEDGTSTFNGLRFLPSIGASTRALAADSTNHRVLLLEKAAPGYKLTSQVFCSDGSMVQPNDLAVAYTAGRIYLSGQNFTPDTVVGDGDLWMCEAPASFFNTVVSRNTEPVKAIRLGVFGRTNGVEVSPDEKTLYLSEAFNKNNMVVSNKIWKFHIDRRTGLVSNKQLFVDFQLLDGTGDVDIDGMRVDVHGNLYVTRNGSGQVLKFSPDGRVLLRINLQGIVATTNLEFGGPEGKSLVIVGQCDDGSPFGEGKGCANVWRESPAPGHAFRVLNYMKT